ncbi:MAG: hypothetical protein HRF42_05500 [Candidatus Brocadia sp.]|jgi:hypothetical protein
MALVDVMMYFLRNKNVIPSMGSNARNFTETNGITAHEAYEGILSSDSETLYNKKYSGSGINRKGNFDEQYT